MTESETAINRTCVRRRRIHALVLVNMAAFMRKNLTAEMLVVENDRIAKGNAAESIERQTRNFG